MRPATGRLYAPVGRLARGFDRGERANEPELLALVCSQCDRTHAAAGLTVECVGDDDALGFSIERSTWWPCTLCSAWIGEKKAAEKKIDAIVAATDRVAARHPSFTIGEAGSISSGKALDKLFNQQLALAGERSIPITIVVLIPSQLIPMDPNVTAVVLLIGLAVGVDYSLFYIKREREERAAGKDPGAALAADGILPQLGWR